MGVSTAALGSWAFSAGSAVGLSAGAVDTIGTAAEYALGAGALSYANSKLVGGKRPVIPPNPVNPAATDESEQNAQRMALQRQSIAGGINSTVGTGNGGQGGSMLNPGNMGGKTLLGE